MLGVWGHNVWGHVETYALESFWWTWEVIDTWTSNFLDSPSSWRNLWWKCCSDPKRNAPTILQKFRLLTIPRMKLCDQLQFPSAESNSGRSKLRKEQQKKLFVLIEKVPSKMEKSDFNCFFEKSCVLFVLRLLRQSNFWNAKTSDKNGSSTSYAKDKVMWSHVHIHLSLKVFSLEFARSKWKKNSAPQKKKHVHWLHWPFFHGFLPWWCYCRGFSTQHPKTSASVQT